jgi:hypothetical protein
MASFVTLDDVSFGDEEIDAAFRRWREAIEQANHWSVSGPVEFDAGPTGYSLLIKTSPGALSAVAATGGIGAAPDANTLGQGNAVLRYRKGASLMNGPTVKVYSNFLVAVPAGTRLEVAPDGADYKLVGADCPTS